MNTLIETIAVLYFAVKLNYLVKIMLCLNGCANCFKSMRTSIGEKGQID